MSNYVAFVLDRSSSMGSCWAETVSGFNEHIDVIRNVGGAEECQTCDDASCVDCQKKDIKTSLVLFNQDVHTSFWNAPLSALQKIDEGDVRPAGMTALYDAVGYTIDKLRENADDASSILLVILTDGFENSSREYKGNKVKQTIENLQKTGKWTFTFMGSNEHDVFRQAADLGIMSSNTIGWETSSAGAVEANSIRTSAIRRYALRMKHSLESGHETFSSDVFYSHNSGRKCEKGRG